ncbi:MAG: ATP-binding protein, partial [Mariprofundaceae bacterium]|nr:ATP-binding protein [Mariprofundaceae bacterium]
PPVHIRLTQLEQILMNLIKNAAEASPEGGAIDVCIRIGRQDSSNESSEPAMIIQVTDHGVGIPEDDLDQVTRAFWTSRKNSGGTGLGLAMVQRIVRQHNGSFHIDSTLGKGTSVTLMFPMIDKQAPTTTIKKTTPTLFNDTDTACNQAWNILLVDDNPDVILVHQHMLERMGHHVSLAYNGKEALACFQKDLANFHCIVTDFIMPHMDGIDLCQHIRQQNPSIPLLMITAFGENNRLQKCQALDIRLVSKPISFQGLKQTIDMMQGTQG